MKKFLLLASLANVGAHAAANPEDPRVIRENWSAYKLFQKRNHALANERLEEALALNAGDPYTRFNYATNKLMGSIDEKGQVNLKTAEEAVRELESLRADVNRMPKASRPPIAKELAYQLGQAYESMKNVEKALENYYASLRTEGSSEDLDPKAKVNISRLLTMSQQGGGGGGGGEKKDNEGGGDKGEGKDGKGENKEFKSGKDDQGKPTQKPKFDQTDVSEQEARQILESVKGEEQDVQKRKTQNEARERARKTGEKGNPDERGGPQW